MRRRRLLSVALAGGTLTLLSAAGAGAAIPRLGTYAGTTSQGKPINFTVSNNATLCVRTTPPCVRRLRFALFEQCSQGSTLEPSFRPGPNAIHVRRTGLFSHRFGLSTEPPLNVRGIFTTTTFVRGTLSDTEEIDIPGARVTCFSGRVTFTATKR